MNHRPPYRAAAPPIPFAVLTLLMFPGMLLAQFEEPREERIRADRESKVKFLNPDYLVFEPRETEKGEKIPLLIYLHGAGGVGDDAMKNRARARQVTEGITRTGKGPCLVVAPQCRRSVPDVEERPTWIPEDLEIFLEHVLETHPEIDKKRVYLTGNSMGGYGCWVWGGHHPEHFAAIAPIVGGIGRGSPKDVAPDLDVWAANLAKVPVYAFAGAKDRVVPAERSERMITAIRKAGGKEARLKIYPDESHGASRVVFGGDDYFDWLFSQKKP